MDAAEKKGKNKNMKEIIMRAKSSYFIILCFISVVAFIFYLVYEHKELLSMQEANYSMIEYFSAINNQIEVILICMCVLSCIITLVSKRREYGIYLLLAQVFSIIIAVVIQEVTGMHSMNYFQPLLITLPFCIIICVINIFAKKCINR